MRDISSTVGCDTGSSLKSDWSQIAITGFTNSSGIWHVVQLLSEASGFDSISMDLHPNSSYCDKPKYLFIHSTLPRSIINCQISELVIVLRHPESIIRSEYLHLLTSNSLNDIKKVTVQLRQTRPNSHLASHSSQMDSRCDLVKLTS